MMQFHAADAAFVHIFTRTTSYDARVPSIPVILHAVALLGARVHLFTHSAEGGRLSREVIG